MNSHSFHKSFSGDEREIARSSHLNDARFRNLSFHGRGLQELELSQTAQEFFDVANIRFLKLSQRRLLSARTASFPQVRFVHAHLPESHLVWQRNSYSRDTATLVFKREGSLEFSSSAMVHDCDSDITLVPPGSAPVHIRTTSVQNEVLYLSIREPLFADILTPSAEDRRVRELDVPALKPLLAFVASTCAVTNADAALAAPLQTAAHEVARSLLIATFGEQVSAKLSTFALAHTFILENFTKKSLTVQQVAEHAGVSVRTLQQALSAEGTSFTRLLQNARSAAAVELRQTAPSMKLAEVAHHSGFGSLSSLHRAFRSLNEVPSPLKPFELQLL